MLKILKLQIPCQHRLPSIPILEQLLLIIVQLLLNLSRKLKILTQNNRIYRTSLLAKTTINTLCHINIISDRLPGIIHPGLSLNSNSIGRTGRLTQLTGNASLLSSWVPPKGMLSSKDGTDWGLLKWVVYGPFWLDC